MQTSGAIKIAAKPIAHERAIAVRTSLLLPHDFLDAQLRRLDPKRANSF